jgi:hypothetical protein
MTTRPLSIDRVAAALALSVFALIAACALVMVDPNWDTLQYHLPYAARVAGLCDAQCLEFPGGIELRYTAFPMAFHALFGLLWRLTGTPTAGHAIGLSMLGLLCVYLRWRFRVPLAWSWLAFVAVPLVQIHLTSSYADLTANAAVALAMMAAFRLWLEPDAPIGTDVVIALAALTFAAGTKLQMVPVTLVVWGLVVVAAARNVSAQRDSESRALHNGLMVGLLLVGFLCLTPQLIRNAINYGNPFFPIEIHLGALTLHGPETMRQHGMSIGAAWESHPGWLRWLASVLEFDAFRGRLQPWTIDQGDVPFTSPSFRMGGYYAPYVLALLTLVIVRARAAGKTARPLCVMIGASLLCAFLPLSHELRYYQFWMLTLVAMALLLAFAPTFADDLQARSAMALRAIVLIALASVTFATGATYLRFHGSRLAALVAPTNAVVDALPPGATLCVAPNYRDAFLYSPLFHARSDYHVRAIDDPDTPGCTKVISPP